MTSNSMTKEKLKNKERKWLKYRMQDLWLSYKREGSRYNTMLRFKE